MRKIWLVTTDHLESELWFRDEEDFKVGMNFVAIQAASCPDVSVLAFILMSNHVHFVLSGDREDAENFVCQYKHRYSIYYSGRWDIKKFLRNNGVDISEIPREGEAVERAVAYVLMNCVAANICCHPTQYLWGSGNCYFRPEVPSDSCASARPTVSHAKRASRRKVKSMGVGGMRIGDLSVRARERLLHSNFDQIPCSWRLTAEGFISPMEYVDVTAVESFFSYPKRLNYFLNASSKARKRLESEVNLPAFRDQTILSAVPELCRSLFQKGSFQALSPEERAEFMRQIRFRFSADINQIARVCGLTYAEAARMMDGI